MSVFALLAAGGAGCGRGEPQGAYEAVNRADCLPDITLTDQNGKAVTLSSLKGKPVLIDFIYVTCTATCPMLTQRIAQVARKLGPALGADVRIVSLTLDPEHDTPADLARYAKAQDIPGDGWIFLTGKPSQVDAELALFGLRREREKDGSITHNVAAFLLGPDGKQVRQYNALEVPIETLVGDLQQSTRTRLSDESPHSY